MGHEYHYRFEWLLQASPEALWPFVADTDRFDQDAGLPPVERLRKPDQEKDNGGQRVRMSLAGMNLEWQEQPFEWVQPHWFSVVREYFSGPVERLRVLVELEAQAEGGTRLRYQIWSTARNWLGGLLIPIQVGVISKRKFEQTFRRFDRLAAKGKAQPQGLAAPEVTAPARVRFTEGGERRLETGAAALQREGVSVALVERLRTLIRLAPDAELTHLRPYALADEWQAPRSQVLELFLRATRAGLLNLQWDLLCPLCRGAEQSSSSLGGLATQVHCESCNIDFTVSFERSVELTFRPNSAVREVTVLEYCVGGPMVTPHILVQRNLPTGAAREVPLRLEPGRYRARSPGLPGGQHFEAALTGAEALTLRLCPEGWPDHVTVIGLSAILRLENGMGAVERVIIERMQWTDQAVTAAEVTALQVFRDLFSSEALRPGEQISVGMLAVLFTDLRDSSRMYRQIGDAPAFGRVMTHFDVLREAVAAEEGALVKTIGDAVMAVFRRPVKALRAALRAQAGLRGLGLPPLTLKAGIHCGPCIAVTLNERLDYFGSTVNLAARVQRFSGGGDVVISKVVREDAEVVEFLGAAGTKLRCEKFQTDIPGFDDEHFDLWRTQEGLL